MTKLNLLASAALLVTFANRMNAPAAEFEYPATERIDHYDVHHGVSVPDPYRWLEEDVRESARVRNWVEAQNKLTYGFLGSLPNRDTIKKRLSELWDYEKFQAPFKAGGRYYIQKNDGLQNHFVVYQMDSIDGERKVLFDPNKWSNDGTTALGSTVFSDDGRYVAYSIQEAGSDWRTWKIREIESGEDLLDRLDYLKFTSVAWDSDSKGLFYAKYPNPDPSQKFQSLNKEMKVMYHRVGTRQDQDVVVFYRPDHPEWGYQVQVSDDGRYLILTVWVGTDDKYRVMYKDLAHPHAMPVELIGEFENDYTFIDNEGPMFFFRTDRDAPKGRIIAIDIRKPDHTQWIEIVGESDEPLQGADVIQNLLICSYLKDVTTRVKLFTLKGQYLRDMKLPGLGTARGFDGKRTDSETFYLFDSYATPPSVYHYDFITDKSKLIERAQVDFNPDDYRTEQVFYPSKDGTKIPMFITYKKTVRRDGNTATLLYGYGGFNISILPSFSVSRLGWMELGGIYAVANLRGGSEYGQAWHEAGKKQNKQNVFDDFIAAAEYLVKNNYTSPKKLGILGRSNGGLLVGACMTQRPDLFGAAVPQVGVMDMLRFDEFTAGRFWVDDYGSAKDSKEMFEALRRYSPYQNLRSEVRYPATLVTTADTDDRVVPGHSFKFAAELQHAQAGPNPVLIRIDTGAGHGSGKPTSKLIEEEADIYAFLASALKMDF
ncbi:MAG: prolyl oligopeptidase family serine peptidase [Verrucomicrobia bacterium]|nr:prolyl oligopeptidase family serine peptidase [Verrucomicrobiota bacterium]